MSGTDRLEAIKANLRERPSTVWFTDAEWLVSEIARLREALQVVARNFDKCRLARADDVTNKHGFVQVPHEECIDEIHEALKSVGVQCDE